MNLIDPEVLALYRLSTEELERRVDEFCDEECPRGRLDLEQGGCTCIERCALGYYPAPGAPPDYPIPRAPTTE